MDVEDNLKPENQETTEVAETTQEPKIVIKTVDENFVEPQFIQETTDVSEEIETSENLEETEKTEVLEGKNEVEQEVVSNVVEIDDEKAIAYLKSKGIEVNSFDELKPKETQKLSPEIEKFIEFTKNTGNNNYQDFLETQKDWSSVSEQERIIEKMKIDYPDLDQEDILLMFEDKYGYDEDLDDEKSIRLRKIALKVDAQDALRALESRKEQYKVNRGSEDLIPEDFKAAKQIVDQQKANELIYAEKYNSFVSATESLFKKDFGGFKVKIGEEEHVIKPLSLEQSKKDQLDIVNLQKKYFDNEGNIVDVVGYHKALYAAMNPDKFAEHFYNLGRAKEVEDDEKASKNITMDISGKKPQTNLKNITVRPA